MTALCNCCRKNGNIVCVFLPLLFSALSAWGQPADIALRWLEKNKRSTIVGADGGVPFARGAVKPGQTFRLRDQAGREWPLETRVNAYWDDGSVKWLGLTTIGADEGQTFVLSPGSAASQYSPPIDIAEDKDKIRFSTSFLSGVAYKSGEVLLDSLRLGERLLGLGGRLSCLWQNGPDGEIEAENSVLKRALKGEIEKAAIEHRGAYKVVIRLEGRFFDGTHRSICRFITRLYLYQDVAHIRATQTLIYEGTAERDFIKGIGWQWEMPFREAPLNRHVRFGGEAAEGGIWAEPVQPVTGRRVLMYNGKRVYEDQMIGKRIPNAESYDAKGQALIKDWAAWRDYRLTQHGADGFSIQKRTHAKGAWIDAAAGHRARGLAFVGDASGGITAGIRHFWQSHPAAFDITQATGEKAQLRAWLWSPFAEAMDMRHYDTLAYGHGLEAAYEDIQPGFSTATGVARTSELYFFLHDSVPSARAFDEMASITEYPSVLAASPEYLHEAGAFGVWSLPNRSGKLRQWIENQLDTVISVYQKEIEQRRWYGYWNYGDVMHTYDSTRSNWRYDIGGYAWANTELMPDLWLWYSFLRTGRADIFRMAEAMTRHTSEVDVYHTGRFAGLGSRHNVRHWGDGAKEIRIAQAALKRFYYYLSGGDERSGELMRAVAYADTALVGTDPLRMLLPKSAYPTHARIGPDWLAMVGNWMTEWERTGDARWKAKIARGVACFAAMPYGFFSGKEGAFGYDPATGAVYQLAPGDIGQSHLSVLMGGPEVAFELSRFFDNTDWNRLWLQFCQNYGSPAVETEKTFGKAVALGNMTAHYCRLPAWYARKTRDRACAAEVWKIFLADPTIRNRSAFYTRRVAPPSVLRPLLESPGLSTNNAAQWSLNAIEMLELIGEWLPETHEVVRE